jgi:SAM-dependent methyltransferase
MLPVIQNWAQAFIDPLRVLGLARLPRYLRQLATYRAGERRLAVHLRDTYPCLADGVRQTPFDPHYFYQGAWLARALAATRPTQHVDVGSSVLTLSTVSAAVPTVFVDYRPLPVSLPGLQCLAGDACRLPFADGSIASLSCLHVIEHIGLGRYGDRLDPDGPGKAARELGRVLAPGGRLYLSVPVGRERVCFNAHRVFAPQTVLALLSGVALERFSLVDDEGRFVDGATIDSARELDYGCGMFALVKHAR